MLGYAGNEIELSTKQEDGATTREHLESLQRQTGEMQPELEPVECPECVLYLWEYFLSMSKRRTGNGYTANAISDANVVAWAARRGLTLSPWENEALDGLEAIFLAHQAKLAAAAVKK